MHYLESYALNAGVKISDPFIYEDFFPLSLGKDQSYITLDISRVPNSRKYKYWKEVIAEVVPVVESKNISIIQLNCEAPYRGCHPASNPTENQIAYLIKNSLLHIGVDNINSDIASSYNKKQICLISTVHESVSRPYWAKENCKIISPEIDNKPSYFDDENPQTINSINPEKIVDAIFTSLEIKSKRKFDTIFIGELYPSQNVHFVSDAPIFKYDLSLIDNEVQTKLRLDMGNPNPQIFMDAISRINSKEISIVTKNPFDAQQLLPYKDKVNVIYIIGETNNSDFVRMLRRLGFKFQLMSDLPEDKLSKIKLDYMDLNLIKKQQFQSIEDFKKSNPEEGLKGITYYQSCKKILSNGKVYPSEYALATQDGVNTLDDSLVFEAVDLHEDNEMSKLFWKDLKYFKILKEIV